MTKTSNEVTMEARVQRNLANQVETQHLLSDIEDSCIKAQYEEHIASYAEGMNELKVAKLGNPDSV